MRGPLLRLLVILMVAVTWTGGGRHVAAIVDAHAQSFEMVHASAHLSETCADCDEHGSDHHGCPHAHVSCCGALALAPNQPPFKFATQGLPAPFDLGPVVALTQQPSYLPPRPPSFAA